MYQQKYLIFCLNFFIVYFFAVRFLDRNVPIMGGIEEKIVRFSEAFMRKYFPLRLAE